MRALRLLAILSFTAMAFVMWGPKRHVMGIDLGSNALQAGVFAFSTFCMVVLRGVRLHQDPYTEFRSNFLTVDARTIGFNVIRIVLELVLVAAVLELELGQGLLPDRVEAFGDFSRSALAAIAVGAVLYGITALALRTPAGTQLVGFWLSLK